jgi:DNA-binding NarL/FixJ family response regulator
MRQHYPTPVRLQLRAPNLLRQSFSRLLERLPRFQITGNTATPADVLLVIELESASHTPPPESTALPVALILPAQQQATLTRATKHWHALALLSLEDDLETLTEGIEAAFAHRSFRSPRLSASQAPQILSPSESEVAHWVCGGLSNAQIAEKLHLSEGTVKSHLVHVFRKLEIQRRSQLIAWCQKSNFS